MSVSEFVAEAVEEKIERDGLESAADRYQIEERMLRLVDDAADRAADQMFSTQGRQQFVIDEVDKLPRIDNVDELASAGQSAGARGILVAQDVHQLDDKYGGMAESIWSDCPNRFAFRAGDAETAEFALSSLGEIELYQQSVSTSRSGEEYGREVSGSYDTGLPLTTGDLTNLDQGEALVQSRMAGGCVSSPSESAQLCVID